MTDHESSAATRYLSAGVYADAAFRDAAVRELYGHRERVVAPSYGFDAVTVLAHALKARRLAMLHAAVTAVLWVLGFVLLGGYFLFFAVPSAVLLCAGALVGDPPGPVRGAPERSRGLSPARRRAGAALRLVGRLLMSLYCVASVAGPVLADADRQEVRSWGIPLPGDAATAGLALFVPLLMSVVVALHRWSVTRNLIGGGHGSRPIDVGSARARKVELQVRREQHSPLVLYGPGSPFIGAGAALSTTVVTTGLRRLRPEAVSPRSPRHPSPPPSALHHELFDQELLDRLAPHVQETLRGRVTIEQCLFLPAKGLSERFRVSHGPESVASLLRDADADDDGSVVRNYLRIQVGGADGRLVTTVFVRVQVRGGMLTLEIASHLLQPVNEEYRAAYQHLADESLRGTTLLGPLAKWLRAVGQTPTVAAQHVVDLARQGAELGTPLWSRREAAAVDGPRVSLRELGSGQGASRFEEMDADRLAEVIRIRVVAGLRATLRAEGYATDAFDETAAGIAGGGVFIGPVSGSSFSVGEGVRVREEFRRRPSGSREVQAPGHGPPGPTTNPDDDEWPEV